MVKVRFSSNLSLKKNRRWGLFLAVMGTMALVAVGGIVLVPALAPSTAGQSADALRGIVGPQAVAQLESVSFRVQDVINQYRYKVSGDQPQISWHTPPQPIASKPGNASIVTNPSKSSAAIPAAPIIIANAPSISDT